MPDHYYSENPNSAHKPRVFADTVLGQNLTFHTDAGVFSRDGVDTGSRILMEAAGPLSGKVLDMVVYSCDYSKVALIISDRYEDIAEKIYKKLGRGATFLNGEGSYTNAHKKVILTAIKKHQLADLKQLVVDVDPDAFVIVQEAHQVLGDGFARYTEDSL